MPDGGIQIVAQHRARAFSCFRSFDTPRPGLFPRPRPDPDAPPRHPWLATFERSPEAAFNDLISGYADVGPLGRLEAPEAANMLFGDLRADDPAWLSLGWAILGWLEKRRQQASPEDAPGRQRWIREVRDAFDIVALLEIETAAVELRRGFAAWNSWVADLIAAPSRDARAAYWSMLARTQPLMLAATPPLDPFGLSSHWLWICESAGTILPESYLGIGLLGLRRLPETAGGSELPWLTGLAWWADAQRPSREVFLTQWRALKFLYPRTSAHWLVRIHEVLSGPRFRDQGIVAPAWWAEDQDLA